MQFSYVNPTRIFFGHQIPVIADVIAANEKVLVLYGGGSIKHNGVYDQVAKALAKHEWLEFSGVEPNPTKETLDKAAALVKEQGISFILAVGGGSVIDGAKYVAAAAHYDGDGWDILTGKHKVEVATPLAAILTLPATGSESNSGSVITRAETQEKLAFMAPAVQPVFAILDPASMRTLPERQRVNGLADAWVHICEQYITYPTNAMVQDGFAESLLRNLLALADQIDNWDNDEWCGNLMWTANLALNGLIGSGVPQDWATHMIGHELTAHWGVDHGRSLTIIQPSLLRNQIENKRVKLEQMGRNVFALEVGPDLAERTIAAIEAFFHKLNLPTQLTEYGCTKNEAIDMVLAGLKGHGHTALGEHQAIDLDNSRKILEMAVA